MVRVRENCVAAGVVIEQMVAWVMAMAFIESANGDQSAPTALALYYCNIFGVHWLPGDEARGYRKVSMPANEFEPKGTWIDYRGYGTQEECIRNLIWHVQESSIYADLLDHAEQSLVDGVPADQVYSVWLQKFYGRWAEGNPKAEQEIRSLFYRFLNRPPLEPGEVAAAGEKKAKKVRSSSPGSTPGQRKVKVAKATPQGVD